MILCIDVGNTNIKYGLFEGDVLKVSFRGATELKRTSDEYGTILTNMLSIRGILTDAIDGAIIFLRRSRAQLYHSAYVRRLSRRGAADGGSGSENGS